MRGIVCMGPSECLTRKESQGSVGSLSMVIHARVRDALRSGRPVLALESTVITHGLPWPANLELAEELEAIAHAQGVEPATIAVVAGRITIGLSAEEKRHLAQLATACWKLSSYDLPVALARKAWGSTTVAGTLFCAQRAGIQVFATGGIGGVHRGYAQLPDVSHDLVALARHDLVTVSAGAKAILDLPATWEQLETQGVLTVGWRCTEFPAFYYGSSGISLPYAVEHATEVAEIYRGRTGGILLVNPVPREAEIPRDEIEPCIAEACAQAAAQGIRGKALTPFLLHALKGITGGRSVETNCALLRNNVEVGAQVASSIARAAS
jgi:pseudouridine-5'-phosphate glycosidase